MSRTRSDLRRLCAGLLLLALAVGRIAAAEEPPQLTALHYHGLTRVDTALVTDAVRLHVGDPLYGYRVTQSVEALYRLGLFDQIRAEASAASPDCAELTFHFTERRPIHEVRFTGHDFFSVEDLRAHATLAPRQLLRPREVFRTRHAIEQAYRQEGYAQAHVACEIVPDSSGARVVVELAIDEGQRVKVRTIRFTGNQAFPTEELRGKLKTKPKGFLRRGRFTPEQLEEDRLRIEEFYHNSGYKDAVAEVQAPTYQGDGEWAELTFAITEGPQYQFLAPEWEGATVFTPAELLAITPFQPGEPYNQSKIDAAVAAAGNYYTERGYLTGLRIDPVTHVRGDSVAVHFLVGEGDPSRVGDVNIVGNTTTKERVIRRELKLYPGSVLRRSQLLRSQRDIFATGFFEDVQVEFEPGLAQDEVDVTFRVKEKSSVVATAGAGYSSQVGLTGFVEFGHKNLFGSGQSVSLKLERGGKRDYYDLSFTEPWVMGRPISAGFDLYNTELYREIYTAEGSNESYWYRRRGAGLRFGVPWLFAFPDYTRLSFGYSLSDTRYTDTEGLPEETAELLAEGQGTISRFYVTLYRNSTDNPFHPKLGTRTTLRSEFNGGPFQGDMDYYQITLDHRQYFVPFWKPVLMLRWRLGLIDTYQPGGRMAAAERFRLGGTTGFDYFRGYDDYYVVPEENVSESSTGSGKIRFPGGRMMFGITAEIQFPIVDPVHGVIFLDVGDTWNNPYDATLNGLKFGSGVGVTLEIPMLGPLGFYYGYGNETRDWVSHFAFGTQL